MAMTHLFLGETQDSVRLSVAQFVSLAEDYC